MVKYKLYESIFLNAFFPWGLDQPILFSEKEYLGKCVLGKVHS